MNKRLRRFQTHPGPIPPASNLFARLPLDCGFKDVPGGIPKSDLLRVTVASIHVAGQ